MLIALALSGQLQIFHCFADAVVEQLEPNFCMLFLIVGGLFKDGRNLLITILFCLGCVIGILVSCL